MKKLFALLMTLSLLLASGCGSKNDTPPADDTNDSVVEEPQNGGEQTPEDSQGEDADSADPQAEEKTFTGALGEVKDFMFDVTAEDGTCYAFGFEGDKPEGLADLKSGDLVTVTYTGEVSEVDPFQGTIISVELAQ